MTAPRIAVTGASGYIGSRLVRSLGDRCAAAITRAAVAYLPDDQVELDLLGDDAHLEAALEGADAVVHLAGHNEVVARDEPERARAETVRMTDRVLEAAARSGVRRVVYVSTVHVYGDQLRPGATVDEAVAPAPTSAYAEARLHCEELVRERAAEALVLRLTNAVGAPADAAVDRWTLVAADLCRQAVEVGALELRSSGQQWRDFVALADVCAAIGLAADPGGPVPPGTYNLGSGTSRTVLSLAELVVDRYAARAEGRRIGLHTAAPVIDPPGPYTVAVDALASHGFRAGTSLAAAVDELLELCATALPASGRSAR